MKKTKNRFILTLMMVVCVAITSLAVPVSATGNVEVIDSLPNFGESYIPSSMINYSIDDKMNGYGLQSQEDIIDIIVSNENVEIEANMYSEYIDVFGKLENGKYINITDGVVCEFEDESIALWIFGRILAEKKGSTTAVLKYNGLSKEITVTVNNQIISDSDISIGNAFVGEAGDMNAVMDSSSSAREDILNIAKGMVDVQWTPAQTFDAWPGWGQFVAGQSYTGLPYTQYHIQSTLSDFNYALNNSSSTNFYINVLESSKYMPRYGNDC